MALDPKYAELPWIAHGQPDFYEAGELPEVDQKNLQDNQDSLVMPKEIEIVKLSVDDAHRRFADSKVDASKVDFSDSIAGSGKIGYTIEAVEYDILPTNAGEHESPLSKLQRLQAEVAQFVEDLNRGDLVQDEKSKVEPTELCRAAESIGEQLKRLQVNDFATEVNSNSDAALLSKVMSQMDSFAPDKPDDRKATTSSHLVYELYDRQDLSKLSSMEKVSELDRRIEYLEALIGQPDPSKLSALTADTARHSLLEATARLSRRTALLQPNQLDMIETRLSGLQARLQTITEKREAISDADTQNKVAELYELVKKWNDVADSLPLIVERLSELKDIHEEASEFSSLLSSVEVGQKATEEKLASYSKLLEEVKRNMGENMQLIKTNLSSLSARLT